MRFRAKGGGLAIAFATVASAVTLLVPAQSSAVTFGANLARAPDNTTACNDPSWFFFYSSRPARSTSRTWRRVSPGRPGRTGRGEQGARARRADDRADAGRGRAGPAPGQPRRSRSSDLRLLPGHQRRARSSHPTANAITQIAVNLPIRQDIAPDPKTGHLHGPAPGALRARAQCPDPSEHRPERLLRWLVPGLEGGGRASGRVRRPGRRDPAERRLVQVLEGEQGPGIQEEEEEAGLRQQSKKKRK